LVELEILVRGIGLKHYKIWQAPLFAFFSTQFYRELGANGKGLGFVYLLALLAIASTVTPLKELVSVQSKLMSHGPDIVEQMPAINIEAGKLSIDRSSPFCVSDPQSGEYIVAFDMNGQYESPDDLNAPFLVTPDKIMSRGATLPPFMAEFKNIQHFHASPQELAHLLVLGSCILPILGYVLVLPGAWVAHILQALGFSLAGLILAKAIGVDIKYRGILRIACLALGNVILLDAVMQLFPLDIPGAGTMNIAVPNWGLYKFFLALGFTLFGVGANLSPPRFESSADDVGEQR
jgi:hypothetical protein